MQEYDLRTGKLIRSWDALDHIPLGDSRATLPTNGFPWDAYHVNAINVPGDGTFVVSMRNTWAAYKVDIDTGKIVWTLGGRHSSFKLGRGAEFEWQHDVAVYPGSSLVTMFDDHCCQITGGGTYVSPTAPSRGLVLKLNQANHTATLAGQFSHGSSFDAEYMGSVEPLANGDEFVGWGSAPYLSEFSRAVSCCSMRTCRIPISPTAPGSSRGSDSRCTRLPAPPGERPAARPSTRAGTAPRRSSPGGCWRVPARARCRWWRRSRSRASRPRSQSPVPSTVFRLQALDARGRVIGTSRQFRPGS